MLKFLRRRYLYDWEEEENSESDLLFYDSDLEGDSDMYMDL